jgi:anti-anti-sigma regulatory factor
MQPSAWMTVFLFDKWLDHFIPYMQKMGKNMSMKFSHLLIMDGCASHMIVGVVAKARAIGLDLITLSSHTLHALQPP